MKILRRFFIATVYRGLALLLYLFRVRIIRLTHPDRIGHLGIELDCYIKERLLGGVHRHVDVFLVPESRAANKELLSLWRKKLRIVTSDFWCQLLEPLTRFPFVTLSLAPYAVAINDTASCVSIYARWKGRQPILALPEDLSKRGWDKLSELGVPRNAWFVCVHSREGGYSPADEHLHSYRNSDISNYLLAIEAIVERGGWCIRVGEPTSRSFRKMAKVIDYAHSDLKSDWMDVFLCASCRFFLGNSSGLYLLSSIFGVRSALANLVPVANSLPVMPGDIGIPKILIHRGTGKPVSYAGILGSPVGDFRFAEQYETEGLIPTENSAEDIRDLAIEMLDQCDGRAAYTPEDESLQLRYQALFRKGHYSYGAASRVGRNFLRSHAGLL